MLLHHRSTAMDSTAERRRRPMVQKQRPAQLHRLTELHPSQHAATMKTVLDRADRTTRTTACAPRISTSTLRTSHQREMQRIYVESAVQLSNTMFAEQRRRVGAARTSGVRGERETSFESQLRRHQFLICAVALPRLPFDALYSLHAVARICNTTRASLAPDPRSAASGCRQVASGVHVSRGTTARLLATR